MSGISPIKSVMKYCLCVKIRTWLLLLHGTIETILSYTGSQTFRLNQLQFQIPLRQKWQHELKLCNYSCHPSLLQFCKKLFQSQNILINVICTVHVFPLITLTLTFCNQLLRGPLILNILKKYLNKKSKFIPFLPDFHNINHPA